MLEFLRSMLELSGHEYEVLAVPSAEEGLLELQRTNFDLLITDIRLPGMSGFDLIRRARRFRPDIAVIILTAYSSPQGRQEAESLNVYRYFTKPLDTETMLTAVNTLLHGTADETPGQPAVAPRPAAKPAYFRIQQRLESLRADTGATGLALANMDGEILHEIGSQRVPIDLNNLVAVVARNIENGFHLAESLGSEVPFTIQYHAGNTYELYNANIGRHYFITMYFDVTARRGRIGTIWIFTQRAIKDLLQLLSVARPAPTAAAEPTPSPPPAALPTEIPTEPTVTAPATSSAQPAVAADTEDEIDYDAERALIDEVPSWSELTETPEDETDLDALLSVLNLDEDATAVDLDSFWEEAVTTPESVGSGISYEEALKQGLLSLGDAAAAESDEE